ncbi:hypothetical protein ACH427_04430 [Streptomyces sp. NPDC020379]|uniref:hypothetical protein n=1 Tax=Streptomyces sp. NPDC020379 TaxID=3365071 RepID=UPI00379D7AD9
MTIEIDVTTTRKEVFYLRWYDQYEHCWHQPGDALLSLDAARSAKREVQNEHSEIIVEIYRVECEPVA